MSNTVETWMKRVADWRASGHTAEEFSERRPWSPKTLRWWASRLARERVSAATPVVRVAQLVRAPAGERGAVVVDVLNAQVRITIEAGAQAEVVAAVIGILVPREAR